jgi:anti-anti-sigma factor
MGIKFNFDGNVLNCEIEGNIVASVAPQMRTDILEYLEKNQDWQDFHLNLSSVEKVDSIGINLIVGLYKKADSSSKSFEVEGCQPAVLKVLQLFRLQNHFKIKGE